MAGNFHRTLAYRRSIAKDVLGTDDPDKVPGSTFNLISLIAEQVAAKGYKMLSGYDDSGTEYSLIMYQLLG